MSRGEAVTALGLREGPQEKLHFFLPDVDLGCKKLRAYSGRWLERLPPCRVPTFIDSAQNSAFRFSFWSSEKVLEKDVVLRVELTRYPRRGQDGSADVFALKNSAETSTGATRNPPTTQTESVGLERDTPVVVMTEETPVRSKRGKSNRSEPHVTNLVSSVRSGQSGGARSPSSSATVPAVRTPASPLSPMKSGDWLDGQLEEQQEGTKKRRCTAEGPPPSFPSGPSLAVQLRALLPPKGNRKPAACLDWMTQPVVLQCSDGKNEEGGFRSREAKVLLAFCSFYAAGGGLHQRNRKKQIATTAQQHVGQLLLGKLFSYDFNWEMLGNKTFKELHTRKTSRFSIQSDEVVQRWRPATATIFSGLMGNVKYYVESIKKMITTKKGNTTLRVQGNRLVIPKGRIECLGDGTSINVGELLKWCVNYQQPDAAAALLTVFQFEPNHIRTIEHVCSNAIKVSPVMQDLLSPHRVVPPPPERVKVTPGFSKFFAEKKKADVKVENTKYLLERERHDVTRTLWCHLSGEERSYYEATARPPRALKE